MKLYSSAFLFGFGAIVAFFPGASAATESLRGFTPKEESFTDIINCSSTTTCSFAYNSCNSIDEQCQGLCVWVGNRQNGSCVRGSGFLCSDLNGTSRTRCENNGCVWNGSNRTCNRNNSNRSCRSYSIGSDCFSAGCFWKNGVCNNPSTIFKCSDLSGTTQSQCVNKGCFWKSSNRSCNTSNVRSCRDFNTSAACRGNRCVWNNGVCRIPSSSFQCSDLNGTSQTKCVNKGCFWNSSNRSCNTTNNVRSCRGFNNSITCRDEGCVWSQNMCRNPSSIVTCSGPNDTFRECHFMNEFCYTKGNCNDNADGWCVAKPKSYAECSSKGQFSIYPMSSGTGCNSNTFYNSECQAAMDGKNIQSNREDEVVASEVDPEDEELEVEVELKEE